MHCINVVAVESTLYMQVFTSHPYLLGQNTHLTCIFNIFGSAAVFVCFFCCFSDMNICTDGAVRMTDSGKVFQERCVKIINNPLSSCGNELFRLFLMSMI